MQAFITFLEKYFMPVAGKIADQRHLRAIRDGILVALPFLIIGSFFLIVAFPPIEALEKAVAPYRGNLLLPVGATFDIMTILVTFGIGYYLAQGYKLDPIAGGAISLVAFLVSTPFKDGGIPTAQTGAQGLFVGIIVALISVEIVRLFVKNNIVIKMPQGVPPAVARGFSALLPSTGVILLAWLVRLGLTAAWGVDLHQIVVKLISAPLSALGGTLGGAIVAVVAVQLLWSAGIHGAAIVGGIMSPIWIALSVANQQAIAANQPLPNIITTQFFELFIYIGGSGSTLALAFLMLFWAKSKQLKSIGKVAIAPGIFNINEPITFGMPIVMNPILIVPFILTPVVLAIVTYFAMSTGLVARPYAMAPWTSPTIISGWISTGSISASVLQLINFLIGGAIYYPFFRLWDKQKLAEETAGETKATGGHGVAISG